MNFLAHLYLSGDCDDVKFGNFIGDYVKGRDYDKYPALIRKGIILHRKIDTYTDIHPIVRIHKSWLHSQYHKYAGIITDIFYDHFLAIEWQMFSNITYDEYMNNTHDMLSNYPEHLPEGMKQIVPNFIRNKWLKAYQTTEGIESVLIGMTKGTSLPDETDFAMFILRKHYKELKHDFLDYFPQLMDYVKSESDLFDKELKAGKIE